MKSEEAIQELRDVLRRRHFSWSTEDSYCGWFKRFCSYIKPLPPHGLGGGGGVGGVAPP